MDILSYNLKKFKKINWNAITTIKCEKLKKN